MVNRNLTWPVTKSSKIDVDIPIGDPFLVVAVDDTNEEYEPDITKTAGQLVTVHIALTSDSNPAIVKYSKSGDSAKVVNFLNGDQLTAGSGLERPIILRFGDKLNFYADAIVKLQFCEVDLV